MFLGFGENCMKKILVLFSLLLALNLQAMAYDVAPEVLASIQPLQIVDYNPTTRIWSRNLGLNDYVFTKHASLSSGGYSEYKLNGVVYDTDSTYEFLCQGRMFGYNAHTLKLFELTFNGKAFKQRELTDEEIQYFFPDIEIIKVSQFDVNNEFVIELPLFHKAELMIINDTDREFYKYQFEYFKNKNKTFNNIFEVRMPRTLVFSHFKSRDELFPVLKIKVKPIFKSKKSEVQEVLF